MIPCKYCQHEFEPEHPLNIFCSNTCRIMARKHSRQICDKRRYDEIKRREAQRINIEARAVTPDPVPRRYYRARCLAMAGDTPARDAEYRENALTGICGAVFTAESLWGRW